MRMNIYTEELLTDQGPPGQPLAAEVVTAEYVSSRTGEKMTNYGLRVYLKSHPALHYVPGRDDDRSAVTFWCGESNRNVLSLLQMWAQVAERFNLEHHRAKVAKAASDAEAAEAARA